MVKAMRDWFNGNFTADKYQLFLQSLNSKYPGAVEFRLAETPLFVDKTFTNKMLSACESIIDVILKPDFDSLVQNAVPEGLHVQGISDYSHFIAFDFGICENESGELEPQLVEMQGFPSLFAFEIWHDEVFRKSFSIPNTYSPYLGGFEKDSFISLLSEVILEGIPAENVVLLELFPDQQKTRIDFYLTNEYIGIKILCLTDVIKQGKDLFYLNDGRLIPIKRIYNRVVFDELLQQSEAVQEKGKLFWEELNVEWVPHPKWFYQISKYTIPLIRHPYIPETHYLNTVKELPEDLDNYVLKPLFSFAGQGVIIDLTLSDIEAVNDPENWILQRKVNYAAVVQTPDVPAKAEIRIFYCWKRREKRPIPTLNLTRLSKGKMIGVRYNADKEWVGGSLAYFEK